MVCWWKWVRIVVFGKLKLNCPQIFSQLTSLCMYRIFKKKQTFMSIANKLFPHLPLFPCAKLYRHYRYRNVHYFAELLHVYMHMYMYTCTCACIVYMFSVSTCRQGCHITLVLKCTGISVIRTYMSSKIML